jgi:cysteine-rich repeat protein
MRILLRTLALASLAAGAASAQIQPGDLLATEAGSGSIVDIRGGGDFGAAPRFATGLSTPTGICLGPGGDLYVAEGTGDLHVATAGGDLSAAVPFATGLGNALDLACTDSQILVADNNGGKIVDASAGGDLSAATPFASGLPLLARIFRDADGTLWAIRANGSVYDVTAGGDFSAAAPFASGLDGSGGLAEHEGRLLAGADQGGEVVDFTGGGDLSGEPPFASSVPTAALLDVPGLGLFAASGNGSGVFEISAGGDFGAAAPFATGVQTTFGLAGLAYVPGCGDGIEQAGEGCDDGNTAAGDGCSATCTIEPLCGPAPANVCIAAAKGRLTIDERKEGKEKLSLALSKLGAMVGAAELGDPVSGGTRYGVCLYDGAGVLAGELQVARAGETCGKKPCWKRRGESGLAYADPSAADSGVVKVSARGGSTGKGRLSLAARNKASKGQTALPALAAGLAGETAARVQVATSDAACFELAIGTVKQADPTRFQGSAP